MINLGINIDAFLESLMCMLEGMAGIFIVTIIIILCIKLLNYLSSGKQGKSKNNGESTDPENK